MNHQTLSSCHKQFDIIDTQILQLLLKRVENIQAMATIQRPNISDGFGENQATYTRQDLAAKFGLEQSCIASFKVLLMSMTLLINSNKKPLVLETEEEVALCT